MTNVTLPHSDLARRPVTIFLFWVLPFAIASASDALGLSPTEAAWIWSGAMAWMGAGCALNALRCGRLHCFISAPALLLGASAAALIATGTINMGARALGYVTWAALGAAALAVIPELLWRRYA
jgi:hypothetical protein